MGDKERRLIGTLTQEAPSRGLSGRIMARIESENRRQIFARIYSFGVGALASLGALLYLGSYLYKTLQLSGFGQYISLMLSGDSTVLSYWKEIFLSMIDATPIWGLALVMAIFGATVWFGSKTITGVREYSLNT